tara:strand:- start:164 stop:439 length:276 start_codon:yes stop_codon:yes gene_type:complete
MERLQILESKVEEADYAYKEAAKNYKDKMSSVRDSKHVSLIAYNDIRDALIWEKQAHSDLTIALYALRIESRSSCISDLVEILEKEGAWIS